MKFLEFLFGKRASKQKDQPRQEIVSPRPSATPNQAAPFDIRNVVTALPLLVQRCEQTSPAGRTEWLMLLLTFDHARKRGTQKVIKETLHQLFSESDDPRKCLPDAKAFVKLYRSKYQDYYRELENLGVLPNTTPLPDFQPIYSFVGVYIEPLQPKLKYVAIRAKNMQPQLTAYTEQLRSFFHEFGTNH